jgi:predicted negative regulator of RcsB-dependent stress response
MRNAALAGVGMLAWRWWKNRQGNANQTTHHQNQSFSDTTTRPAGSL